MPVSYILFEEDAKFKQLGTKYVGVLKRIEGGGGRENDVGYGIISRESYPIFDHLARIWVLRGYCYLVYSISILHGMPKIVVPQFMSDCYVLHPCCT